MEDIKHKDLVAASLVPFDPRNVVYYVAKSLEMNNSQIKEALLKGDCVKATILNEQNVRYIELLQQVKTKI